MDRCETAGPEGFKPGSLSVCSPLPSPIEIERLVGIPLYLSLNYLPFFAVAFAVAKGGLFGLVYVAVAWVGLYALTYALLLFTGAEPRTGQYLFTERHNQKYCSLRYVWPRSLEKVAAGQPVLFAAIPHGPRPFKIQRTFLAFRDSEFPRLYEIMSRCA